MFSKLRLSAMAVVCLFAVASVVPAFAQPRGGGGSGPRGGGGGGSAAPRSAQGPGGGGGAHAGPRPQQGPGGGGGAQAGPRAPQGPGPAAQPRPPQGPRPGGGNPGQGPGYRPGGPAPGNRPGGPAPGYRPGYGPGYRPGYGPGYRPGYRPGYGYRYPYYGYRGYYPYYGYRGYYPWYGYWGYYPWYSSGLYFGVGTWGWPYYYGAWPYAAYSYYGPSYESGYGAGSGGASLKIEVKPKSAEVYVDGNLAGIVDQFDGMFDSLPLEAGEHEITIYQEGYRSIRQRLNLSPGSSYRIKGALEPLAPGEPNEPRPQASYAAPRTEAQAQMAPQYQPSQQYPQYQNPEPQAPPPSRQAPANTAPQAYPPMTGDSRFGQLAVRVQPGDAEVLINGEPWRAPAGADRLVVFLSPGTHRVEIRREGFDSFVTAVEVRRGEVTPLNVSLARF